MSAENSIELYVPSWRIKLAAGLIITYALWKLAMDVNHIHHDLQRINNALRAEFDATSTPPSERQRGDFPTITTEESEDAGD